MNSRNKKPRGRKAVPAQYRRKISGKKLGAILGGVLLVGLVVGLIVLQNQFRATSSQNEQSGISAPNQVIHLVAGGDLNVTDKTVASGWKDGQYDYTKAFLDVAPVLSRGDVAAINFEGILDAGGYGTATKAAPQEMMKALASAGVDVLQTANSYSIFAGLRGLSSTLDGIRSAGMTPLGTYASNAEFNQSGGYVIWEIQGIKIAMMAFTKGMDGMGLPAGSEQCVNLLYKDYNSTYQKVDTDGITHIVRNAAAHQPDVMVAFVHWGSEFNDQISKTQEKICKVLQGEGVDAIIGTHPHYVQKMVFDAEKGTFVAYSLGDFFGDAEAAGTNYSVLLDLEITKDGKTGETKVTGFEYIPIFTEQDENGNLRVLRIYEAMAGYENRYLDCVSKETYDAMKAALGRIQARVGVSTGSQ